LNKNFKKISRCTTQSAVGHTTLKTVYFSKRALKGAQHINLQYILVKPF